MIRQHLHELAIRNLCWGCVEENYLREEIKREGTSRSCSYCERGGKETYTVAEIAGRIRDAFGQHYRRSPEPTFWEDNLFLGRNGYPVVDVIVDAAGIPEEAGQDVQMILEDEFRDSGYGETEFSSESYYEEKGGSDFGWQDGWMRFERSLKTEARFFNPIVSTHLNTLFGKIDSMSTIDGRSLVVEAGPETPVSVVYRARVFQSEERLKQALCRPDLELGPPPNRLANAGRMNAHGISVFYGADSAALAITEVRPPVGSQVVVAAFEVIRPLRLLDLTAFNNVYERGSIFDPQTAGRMEHATFLRSLCRRMAQPVMPDDADFDYLPTQVIADFLATDSRPLLDGIVFPSVQMSDKQGVNIALFHKASRVERINVAQGTKIEATTCREDEEGCERDYVVYEETPSLEQDETPGGHDVFAAEPADCDLRKPTLRINVESLKVHVIQGVRLDKEMYEVLRHCFKKVAEPDF